jgi:hypothetical protein
MSPSASDLLKLLGQHARWRFDLDAFWQISLKVFAIEGQHRLNALCKHDAN